MISLAFLVLVLAAAQDYVWARYVAALNARLAWRASWLSGVLQAGGAVIVVAYIGEPVLILASVAGSMLGTYLAVVKDVAQRSLP